MFAGRRGGGRNVRPACKDPSPELCREVWAHPQELCPCDLVFASASQELALGKLPSDSQTRLLHWSHLGIKFPADLLNRSPAVVPEILYFLKISFEWVARFGSHWCAICSCMCTALAPTNHSQGMCMRL